MRSLTILFLSLLLLPAAVLPAAASEKNPPVLVFSGIEGSVNSDISMQVLHKAYAKLGLRIRYLPLPGERALRTANAGKVDGEVFRIANVSKRYTNLIQVPTSINTLPGLAFSRHKQIDINGWSSLKPYRLGIQGGIKFAERGTKDMQPIVVDTNHQLFRMLNSGRIDIAIASEVNGLKTLADLKLTHIHILQPPIEEFPLYHYLHKRHAALVPKLDAVLKAMRARGEIQAIRAKRLQQLRQAISD